MNPYHNLTNIRIIQIRKQPHHSFMPIFIEPPEEPDMWIAVYHKLHKKWIITNDIEDTGLNDRSEHVEPVGYAQDIHGIMFVIYEHQKALGMNWTVLDDIKRNKRLERTDREWQWEPPIREPITSQVIMNAPSFQNQLDAVAKNLLEDFKPRKKRWQFWK